VRTPWLACCAVLCACAPAASREPRSVLLITLDTTRADALSCYGRESGTTPALDALAREGTLYERAFTVAPITLTAHTTLLTGLYPPRHGLRDNGIGALDASAHTLAEAARAAGVQTAAFVGAVVLDKAFALDQGFESYDGPPAQRSTSGHPFERPARAVVDGALAWLEKRDRARPFFLWLHVYDAHHPYTPQRALPPEASEHERYLAEVSEVDAELGRVFAALRAEAALDTTLVCVTADHGEAFGEHQELTHGAFAWNTTLHVPLLVRAPGLVPAGAREERLVSAVDVAPTLAEALGVALPDADGRSLFLPEDAARGVYFESYAAFFAFGWSPIAGWLQGQEKYVHSSRPELFDLAADPGEERDLSAERGAEALERFRAAIAAVAAAPELAGGAGEVDDGLRAGIQELGYAGAASGRVALPHPLETAERPSPHAMVGAWRESMVAQERLNKGRNAEAAELLTRLHAGDPHNGFVAGLLATAHMRAKEYQQAMDVLRPLADAATAEPQITVQPQILYKLGQCALKLGRREEAATWLQRAVELAPSEARYRSKLAQARGEGGGKDTEDE